jgi:hypothetical protein
MNKSKFTKQQLVDALKKSGQDFEFDRSQARTELLLSIDRRHLSSLEKDRLTIKYNRAALNFKMAFAMASLILFVGLGATFAIADTALPGDKLFALDQLQEKAVLKLPLPQQTRANIRANILAERVSELNKIQDLPDKEELKVKAVGATEQSLSKTIEDITENREKLRTSGKIKQAQKLNNVLDRLEKLAGEQEIQTDRIIKNISDQKLREEADGKLERIKQLKLKVRLDLMEAADDQDLEKNIRERD